MNTREYLKAFHFNGFSHHTNIFYSVLFPLMVKACVPDSGPGWRTSCAASLSYKDAAS